MSKPPLMLPRDQTYCTGCGTKNEAQPSGCFDPAYGTPIPQPVCPNPSCCPTKGHKYPPFRWRDIFKVRTCTVCFAQESIGYD